MCGIVGYVGSGEASRFLIDGLRRLEYRGYDSAGIAIYDKGTISIEKKKRSSGKSGSRIEGASAHRTHRHRAYPLGDARTAIGSECPSAWRLP